MKKILFFTVLSYAIILIGSCRKSNHTQPGPSGSLARIQDSSGTLYFNYTGEKITSAFKHNWQGLPIGSMTFEYPDHHVKITNNTIGSHDIIDIYLNDSSLPVSMHNGREDTVLYYYKHGTIHLDSVYSFPHSGFPRTYTFEYDGDDISKVSVSTPGYVDSIKLNYKPDAPNLFKAAAPLFYIYSDLTWFGPLTDNFDPYIFKAFFFARAFSMHTLDSYAYMIRGEIGAGQYRLLDADNKVTQEYYPSPFHPQMYFYN